MPDTHNQKVNSVKYISIKNEKGDELDAEILIPTEIGEVDENSKFIEVRALLKLICFLTINIIFVLFLFVYFFITEHRTFRGLSEHQKFTCLPLDNVDTIIFTLIESPNNTCTDNSTCNGLLDNIEKDHKGLKYNFVIGNKGELYVGSGFKCRVNESENVLHIKVLQNNNHSLGGEQHANTCLRITELIEQGLLCGKISSNFSAFSRKTDGETYYNITNNVCSVPSTKIVPNRNFHYHDPEHNIRKLIHGDVKWTFCGHLSSNMKEEEENKVITLESFKKNSCLPFQPVSEVTVDIVESSKPTCFGNSSACVRYFEENHDGFNYNFVFDHDNNIYVGLGFRCKANNGIDNVLKIKKIVLAKTTVYDFISVTKVLNEGLVCGKIHENVTLKADCSKKMTNRCKDIEMLSFCSIKFLAELHSVSFSKPEFHDNQTENIGKFVSKKFSYKACHRKHGHKQELTQVAQASTSTYRYEDVSVSFMETSLDQSTTDRSLHNSEVTLTPVSPSLWREEQENKMLTLESFKKNSCLAYQPVSEVEVDIVVSPQSSCSGNSSACVRYFEENHDGLNYNFVIDVDNNIYVGLGFRCKANNGINNVLKIKQLVVSAAFDYIPVMHILNEGMVCGKIHENFTSKLYCSKETIISCNEIEMYSFCSIKYLAELHSIEFSKAEFHANETENSGKFIPNEFSYKACHKKHDLKQELRKALPTRTSTFKYEDVSVSFTEKALDQSTTDRSLHDSEDTLTLVSPSPLGHMEVML